MRKRDSLVKATVLVKIEGDNETWKRWTPLKKPQAVADGTLWTPLIYRVFLDVLRFSGLVSPDYSWLAIFISSRLNISSHSLLA